MLAFLGLLTPAWDMAHTSSHTLQPEHLSGITVSFLRNLYHLYKILAIFYYNYYLLVLLAPYSIIK